MWGSSFFAPHPTSLTLGHLLPREKALGYPSNLLLYQSKSADFSIIIYHYIILSLYEQGINRKRNFHKLENVGTPVLGCPYTFYYVVKRERGRSKPIIVQLGQKGFVDGFPDAVRQNCIYIAFGANGGLSLVCKSIHLFFYSSLFCIHTT